VDMASKRVARTSVLEVRRSFSFFFETGHGAGSNSRSRIRGQVHPINPETAALLLLCRRGGPLSWNQLPRFAMCAAVSKEHWSSQTRQTASRLWQPLDTQNRVGADRNCGATALIAAKTEDPQPDLGLAPPPAHLSAERTAWSEDGFVGPSLGSALAGASPGPTGQG